MADLRLAKVMAIQPGTINGSLKIVGGDVSADTVTLKTHIHSDPQGGTTGPASG